MSSVLTTRYDVLRTERRQRSMLLSGSPAVATDDTQTLEYRFSTDEVQTFVSRRLLVLELGQVLDVELTFAAVGAAPAVTVRRDLTGLLVLPGALTAVVRCPARFNYTLPIPVRAVLG